ncbi:hypothetical protein [Lysobacter sp. CA196]|uniref:hypothetical protein n=1 Tax=Lysobacter sp. CA196 TaxID=3455606 RepID=UPI003F8D8A1B
MKLRLTGHEPEIAQEPQAQEPQAQAPQIQAPEPNAQAPLDVSSLRQLLENRAAGIGLPAHDQTPASDWAIGNHGWGENGVPGTPQAAPAQAPAPTLEQFRTAATEVATFYRGEIQQHRDHNRERSQHPDSNPQLTNPASAEIEARRLRTMETQLSGIDALTRNPIQPQVEDRVRGLINERVDTLMQVSPSIPRPDVEPIRNIDDVRTRQPHTELTRDINGLYHLADPNNRGNTVLAHGERLFVIPVSNPSQVWIGERANGGHTAISRGGDVYYAGQLTFDNGRLTSWDNDSGHYRPRQDLHQQLGNTSIATLETLLPRDKFVPRQQ